MAAARAAAAAAQAGQDPQTASASAALVAREVDETLAVVTSATVYLLKARPTQDPPPPLPTMPGQTRLNSLPWW